MIIRRIINSKEFIKIKQDPILILTLPIALILTLFLIAIRPFFLIKIGLLHSDRIGHFALNTELYICEKLYFNKKGVDFFYYPTKPCNTQLAKIIERNLVVIPKIIARPFDLIFRKFEFLNAHRTRNLKGDYDVHNLIDKLFIYLISDLGQEIIKMNKRSYGSQLDKFEPRDLNNGYCPNMKQFNYINQNNIFKL